MTFVYGQRWLWNVSVTRGTKTERKNKWKTGKREIKELESKLYFSSSGNTRASSFFFFRHLRCNICPLVAANERPASPFRFKNEVNFIKGLRKNEEEGGKKGENAGSCKVCVRVNGRETVGRVCLLHVANGWARKDLASKFFVLNCKKLNHVGTQWNVPV